MENSRESSFIALEKIEVEVESSVYLWSNKEKVIVEITKDEAIT